MDRVPAVLRVLAAICDRRALAGTDRRWTRDRIPVLVTAAVVRVRQRERGTGHVVTHVTGARRNADPGGTDVEGATGAQGEVRIRTALGHRRAVSAPHVAPQPLVGAALAVGAAVLVVIGAVSGAPCLGRQEPIALLAGARLERRSARIETRLQLREGDPQRSAEVLAEARVSSSLLSAQGRARRGPREPRGAAPPRTRSARAGRCRRRPREPA